jgi:small-conductance mechanosensitive channel
VHIVDGQVERDWLAALAAFLGMCLAGYFARAVIVRRLETLFARTSTTFDDLALAAVRTHVQLWFALGGIALAARFAPVSERIAAAADRVCSAGFSLSLAVAAATLAAGWLQSYSNRMGVAVGTTTLVQHTIRGLIVAVGGLLVLSNLGVSITPLLTALGVGSLAVALALQPTLSNLFAGLHLALARPIRVGDFIELETGSRGYVMDIGWRATRIRELPNNIVIVPNARLAEMRLINFAMPEPEQSALVQVGVGYGSDLRLVERVTIDVAQEVLRDVQGGVPEFQPFIRYHTFGDSSINFSVILRVKEFTDRYLVIHEFIKRLKLRYDRERIEIPFPQRVLHGKVVSVIHPPDSHPVGTVGARG